jgi:ParB/RepB/Spo0J family partition protein
MTMAKGKTKVIAPAAAEIDVEAIGAKVIGGTVDIYLKDIIESQKASARTSSDNPEIKDLAKNIKAIGQLVPVIVRRDGSSNYQLIAGHRRLAACRLAGLAKIWGMVVDATDEQAELIAITENLKREDLSPLEEAAAIKKLLDTKMDRKTAAAVLGWPESKVIRRAKLLELTPEWIEAFKPDHEDEDRFRGWGARHLELIARYDAETQNNHLKELRNSYRYLDSVEDLEAYLAGKMQELKKAAWDLSDAALSPKAGACDACPKRTSHTPGLFDDSLDPEKIKAGDKCLDSACWKHKEKAFLARREIILISEYPNLVKIKKDYGRGTKGVLSAYEYTKAKKGDKGAVPALVVDGSLKAPIEFVKVKRSSSDHKPKVDTYAEKVKQIEFQRAQDILGEASKLLGGKKPADPVKLLKWPIKDVLALASAYGIDRDYREKKKDWELFIELREMKEAALVKRVWGQIIDNEDLSTYLNEDSKNRRATLYQAEMLCSICEIDYKKLVEDAERKFPMPDSSAKAQDDAIKGLKKRHEKNISRAKSIAATNKKIADEADKAFAGSEGPRCKHCGCTEHNACMTIDGPCYWIKPGVCSNPDCVAKEKAASKPKKYTPPPVKAKRTVKRASLLKSKK